jgi:hypothetical protein
MFLLVQQRIRYEISGNFHRNLQGERETLVVLLDSFLDKEDIDPCEKRHQKFVLKSLKHISEQIRSIFAEVFENTYFAEVIDNFVSTLSRIPKQARSGLFCSNKKKKYAQNLKPGPQSRKNHRRLLATKFAYKKRMGGQRDV